MNTITSIQFKRGTNVALTAALVGNDKLLQGEPAWETDSNRLKIGDGVSDYSSLPYLDGSDLESDIVVRGYYSDGWFYTDNTYATFMTRDVTKLYYDIPSTGIFFYKGGVFNRLVSISQVDDTNPGLVKLYSTTGQNIDGTMTQKAITDELNKKVEISLDEVSNECATFVIKSLL